MPGRKQDWKAGCWREAAAGGVRHLSLLICCSFNPLNIKIIRPTFDRVASNQIPLNCYLSIDIFIKIYIITFKGIQCFPTIIDQNVCSIHICSYALFIYDTGRCYFDNSCPYHQHGPRS